MAGRPRACRAGGRLPSVLQNAALAKANGLRARNFASLPTTGSGSMHADPMFIEHEGQTWLFCEEYTLAKRRGVISVAEVYADGSVGAMRLVLERPYHLSYPFVFRDDGDLWMIPESADSGAVELYRAIDFPYFWTLERRIIDGLAADDSTLMQHSGRLFLLLTTSHRMSTSWDSLRIYEARSLSGQFIPHAAGPTIIDSAETRSAGPIFRRGADLIRPVQNCTRIYGGGLTLARIDQLTGDCLRPNAGRARARHRRVRPDRYPHVHTHIEVRSR